jgi:hypothetical protein
LNTLRIWSDLEKKIVIHFFNFNKTNVWKILENERKLSFFKPNDFLIFSATFKVPIVVFVYPKIRTAVFSFKDPAIWIDEKGKV